MYKHALFVYIVCFAVYIYFARQPDSLDGAFAPGQVVAADSLPDSVLLKFNISKGDYPIVQYMVGRTTYYYNGAGNLLLQWSNPQGRVEIIFDANNPRRAAVKQLWGYWITLGELLVSLAGFVILFLVAVGITGNNNQPADSTNLERQRKYN